MTFVCVCEWYKIKVFKYITLSVVRIKWNEATQNSIVSKTEKPFNKG